MQNQIQIFNRKRKQIQQNHAAKNFHKADFLHNEVANRIAEQFELLINKQFERVLVLGTKNRYLADILSKNSKIGKIYESDFAFNFLDSQNSAQLINCDEEFLPFKNQSFDLVISNLHLHWVNDLPGCFIQIKRLLRKDGMFLTTFFGSKTLMELREALTITESKAENSGISPRISPFIDVKEGASLIQRAGFKEPVSIAEEIDVKYENLTQLLHDIKNMGEANALQKMNTKFVGRNFFNEVQANYKSSLTELNNPLNAKFEIISLSGWA